MSVRLIDFLEDHNIEYETQGKNVAEGNLNVNCPLCTDDPSFHLGIHLERIYWSCWRDVRHRGRSFARLIQAILKCSWKRAQYLESQYTSVLVPVDDDLFKYGKEFSKKDSVESETAFLGGSPNIILPEQFKAIEGGGVRRKFYDYLESRGIEDVSKTVRKYNLLCCLSGEWKSRIIFPVYFKEKLVSWTSRTIYEGTQLPYKDLSVEGSVRHTKYCLLNYDGLVEYKRETLWLVEGPFDVLVFDQYLPEDQAVTCLFTKTMRPEQLDLLFTLRRYFNRINVLLDRDAESQAWSIASEIVFCPSSVKHLPDGIKDPGQLNRKLAEKII